MRATDVPQGALTAPSSKDQLEKRGINSEEYVRVLEQALYSLGFIEAGRLLEQESGILLQGEEVTAFREAVILGEWEVAEKGIKDLRFRRGEKGRQVARFYIAEQRYLESIEGGDVAAALTILRGEMSRLQFKKERVHFLSSLLAIKDVKKLRDEANWAGTGEASRLDLLRKIQAEVVSSQMIPDHRLEALLDDAMKVQKSRRAYRNSFSKSLSLLEHFSDTRDCIPNRTVQVLRGHSDEVWYVSFSHNGKYLASASKDKSIVLWKRDDDGAFHLETRITGHTGYVGFVSWNADDSLLLSCAHDNSARVWRVPDGELVNSIEHSDTPIASGWLPDDRFVIGCVNKTVTLYDKTGSMLHRWSTGAVNDLAVTPDGRNIIVATAEKVVLVLDTETKRETTHKESNMVMSVYAARDSRHILVNLLNQEIHLWDLKERRLVFKFDGLKQGRFVIRSCLGGLDEHFVVSGSEDSQVYIWRRNKSQPLAVLPGHSGTINAVDWSFADPHNVASASDDKTVRIWSAEPNDDDDIEAFADSLATNGHTPP